MIPFGPPILKIVSPLDPCSLIARRNPGFPIEDGPVNYHGSRSMCESGCRAASRMAHSKSLCIKAARCCISFWVYFTHIIQGCFTGTYFVVVRYWPILSKSSGLPHWNRGDRKHDDVIKWKHFPRYWPFVQGIHRSPVNSPHKGQWRGALTFSLICAWINAWVNDRDAGDLRHHLAHYDVTVMDCPSAIETSRESSKAPK